MIHFMVRGSGESRNWVEAVARRMGVTPVQSFDLTRAEYAWSVVEADPSRQGLEPVSGGASSFSCTWSAPGVTITMTTTPPS